ncbi:hypothetical protein BDZ91DRAFT_770554 [Kalaharituber pfeilii]|nr:hypothetical protein BDZ91DRAFT_770554 [Kalaharituber pfeilii]
MTVEIDSSLMRAHTAPTPVHTLGSKTISSSINSTIVAQVPSVSSSVASPTTSILSAPAPNDSIINRKADPSQGLYQTCATLRKRLRDVPDFEQKFLMQEEGDEDPVNQLWRIFQKGSSLCVLFNALRPVSLIEDEKLQPDLGTKNACKAACFHFLKGVKEELGLEGEDTFMISHLWSEDTNGFVKVTKTVSRILDELQARNLLLKRTDGEGDQDTTDTKPLDNRARVVQELVETERKYVQDLEALQDYMRTLQASEVAPPDLIHNMFLNLNSLVDFQRRFLIRVETVYAQPPEQQRWGQVMVSHENSFDVYEPYCANFNSAQALAVQEAARLSRVSHPVALAGATAFLIKPVQRICKYPLLLRDMSKYSDPEQVEELKEGIAAIERVNNKVNEAIRKVDMSKVTEDLAQRVEDWKGHRLDSFGSLLLNGQFTVVKGDGRGDLEREYHIYLFQKILLCCKEVGPSKKQSKTMSMGKKAAPVNKKKTSLQLKGRIFMQNVTDIVWMAKNGNYTLQIFWRGDPAVEDFIIKHRNEETLHQWKTLLQQQVDLCHQMDSGLRSSGGTSKTSNTEFVWMQNSGSDPTDYGARSEDELTEDEDDDDAPDGYTPSYTASRNGSNSSLRSRSTTNESGPPPHIPSGLPPNPHAGRQSRYTHQSQNSTSHQPPLTLVTYPSASSPGTQSPDRAGNISYFSPTSDTMSIRSSTVSGAYPFPRQPTPNYHDEARYPAGTPMSRTTSREGSGLTATQAVAGQRLQRPSLSGMSAGNTMQNRMRSASSPNIHHVPTQAQLARSPGMVPPVPVPPMPQTYQAYNGGPAVINRSQNNSPTSPMQNSGPARHASPGLHEQVSISRLNGTSSKSMPAPQVKVRVSYANEIFIIIVPYNITYHQLMDRIERKIRYCGTNGQNTNLAPLTTGIRIRYQDEDGDFITMNSDDDVQMAFDVFCDPNLTEGTVGIVTLHVQI